jgi:hypothetical protein
VAAVPAAAVPAAAPVMGKGVASWVVVENPQAADIPPPPPTFGMALPEPSAREEAPASGGLPSWLVALLSLLAVAGLGAGVVYFLKENKQGTAAAVAETGPVEQSTETHRWAKNVEITGLRLGDERQKLALKFLVVNHSVGPIGGFDLEVQVKAVNAKPEDPALFLVTTPVKNIGPLESREFTVPVNTKLRAYEMPDWNFLRATFRILNAD